MAANRKSLPPTTPGSKAKLAIDAKAEPRAANDDLKTLPVAEVQKRLDSSTTRQGWAERDCGKKGQRVPEVSHLFLGPDTLDD